MKKMKQSIAYAVKETAKGHEKAGMGAFESTAEASNFDGRMVKGSNPELTPLTIVGRLQAVGWRTRHVVAHRQSERTCSRIQRGSLSQRLEQLIR